MSLCSLPVLFLIKSEKVTEMENKELLNKILTDIAQKNFPGVETLKTRNSDDMDFHDVAVWAIKAALEDAFIAGMTTGMTLD
jgi:hypothetical protein